MNKVLAVVGLVFVGVLVQQRGPLTRYVKIARM